MAVFAAETCSTDLAALCLVTEDERDFGVGSKDFASLLSLRVCSCDNVLLLESEMTRSCRDEVACCCCFCLSTDIGGRVGFGLCGEMIFELELELELECVLFIEPTLVAVVSAGCE